MRFRKVIPLAVLLLIAGCATLETMAPPIDARILTAAQDGGGSREILERGRRLYVTECAECHSPEPIARYTVDQWRRILPRMAKESSLDAQQTAELRAYVLAVRSSVD